MIDFGGWNMPLHYGSQIEEHHAVRNKHGIFDISHMLAIDISGENSSTLLRRVLANDIGKLLPGKALYSCMLNPKGNILDDLIVYQLSQQQFRVIVNAGTRDKDLHWLQQHAQTLTDIHISARTEQSIIALQGPESLPLLQQLLPNAAAELNALKYFHCLTYDNYFIGRTGYTGEDGFEIISDPQTIQTLWQQLASQSQPCGLGARDSLRLEAGMNLYGQDMDGTQNPLESGLGWTLAFSESRDFVGKAALQHTEIKHQLYGLLLRDKGVLRHGQSVHTPQGSGYITSGIFSPTLGKSIALARLPAGLNCGDQVNVTIRNKTLRANVVKYPFVRHGKSLIDTHTN